MPKCPICNAAVKSRQDNPNFPFCTARCKTIDLGKWVNEEYRIPVEDRASEDDDGSASGASSKIGGSPEEPVRH
jgi:endogenous inhibitor of DNA gyrase (YacG/DUF329 family)